MAKKIMLSLVVLLLLAGVLGFCGWKVVQRRIARNARAPRLVSSPEPAVDFAFRGLDGTPMRLSETKGKVVFVDLWGTWCIQCVAEMPTVQALYDRFRDDPDVRFLMISRMDSPETVRRYARRNRFDLPFYTMEDAEIPASMQLQQFPATFLYAPDGTLMVKHTGAADWDAPSVVGYIEGLKGKR